MQKFIIIIFLLFVWKLNYSQAPVYSNEFMSIGVDARAISMANSCVTNSSDVASGYWNPAGLTKIPKDIGIALMHNEYFGGISKFDYGAFALKIDTNIAFSFSLIRMATDDIPNTLDLIDNNNNINYDKVSSFSVADYAFIFSYARKNNRINGLRYGINTKIIRRNVGDFANAWGFGFDIGLQYNYKKWIFGFMGRDITSTFNAWSFNPETFEDVFIRTGNVVPKNSIEVTLPKFIFGLARNYNLYSKLNLLTEINFDITTDGKRNVLIKTNPISLDPHLGFELNYLDLIFIRGGIYNIQQVKDNNNNNNWSFQPNFGIGVKFKNTISIDYALSNFTGKQEQGNIVPLSNIFSIKVDLDKKYLKKYAHGYRNNQDNL